MAKYPKRTRKVFLDTMHGLLTQVNLLFYEFSRDCRHRGKARCGHKDYPKDYPVEPINLCHADNCPVMQEEYF